MAYNYVDNQAIQFQQNSNVSQYQQPSIQQSGYFPQNLPNNTPQNANCYHQQAMNEQYPGQHTQLHPQMNFPPLHLSYHTNTDWQLAGSHNKKRIRSPVEENQTSKLIKTKKYWLGHTISTHNRYEKLNDAGDPDTVSTEKQSNDYRDPKPPPIFVAGVKQITPLMKLLNEIVPDKYTIKALHNDEVKIQSTTGKEYSAIIKALEEKQTEYHTYQCKQAKPFRVVLKNVHPSITVEEIKNSIQELGHEVSNIWNVKQRKTNISLPMFFVDLQPNDNNKEIYNVRKLMNLVVRFEAPYTRQEIPQCMRCQRHGHTKNFCTRHPRCVKCAGSHFTKDCVRKERDNNVKCVNCGRDHPANYKGCAIYQQLYQKHFPSSTYRQKDNSIMQISKTPPMQSTQPGISYAQMVKHQTQQLQPAHHTGQPNHITSASQQTDILNRMETMMETFMERMGKMLDLITTLVSKIH